MVCTPQDPKALYRKFIHTFPSAIVNSGSIKLKADNVRIKERVEKGCNSFKIHLSNGNILSWHVVLSKNNIMLEIILIFDS